MEQENAWQASQEMLCLLWNQRVRNHTHDSLPLGPIIILMDLMHTFTPYSLKPNFNINLPPAPVSPICT